MLEYEASSCCVLFPGQPRHIVTPVGPRSSLWASVLGILPQGGVLEAFNTDA